MSYILIHEFKFIFMGSFAFKFISVFFIKFGTTNFISFNDEWWDVQSGRWMWLFLLDPAQDNASISSCCPAFRVVLGLGTSTTVSYTHLDVYKRQRFYWCFVLGMLLILNPIFKNILNMDGSYWHNPKNGDNVSRFLVITIQSKKLLHLSLIHI